MKKTTLRLLALCAALVLLFALAACGRQDDTYLHFTADEGLTTVSDGENTYTAHAIPRGFYRGQPLGETPRFYCRNTIKTEGGLPYEVLSLGEGSGLLLLRNLNNYYYATDAAEAKLSAFFAGTVSQYALAQGTAPETVLLPTQDALAIRGSYAATADTLAVDVTTIEMSNWFPLVAKDEFGVFAKEVGALLLVEDAWYYVDFDALDNSHFDADGYFSFRYGTVEFKKMTGAAATAAATAAARCLDPQESDV